MSPMVPTIIGTIWVFIHYRYQDFIIFSKTKRILLDIIYNQTLQDLNFVTEYMNK